MLTTDLIVNISFRLNNTLSQNPQTSLGIAAEGKDVLKVADTTKLFAGDGVDVIAAIRTAKIAIASECTMMNKS